MKGLSIKDAGAKVGQREVIQTQGKPNIQAFFCYIRQIL